jgi:hypothetical protein
VVHNAIIGSPVATLMELAFLASNAIGWRRFHGRAKMDGYLGPRPEDRD